MRGRLIELRVGRKQQLVVELDGDFRKDYDRLKEKDVDITVKRYYKKRSLDANAYAWVLIDKIAEALNISKTEVYRKTLREIGGVSTKVCVPTEAVEQLKESWEANGLGWQVDTMPSKLKGCTTVILHYGSSTYDTKQMSALIDALVEEAQALGIETLPPDELERLKSLWA